MVAVQRFEDLAVWKKARELARDIYSVSGTGPFAKDWGLSSQIQRAAVSIMSNIAEGFERFRRGEFQQFLSMAKGSCGEVRSQLHIARDLGYLDEERFQKLLGQTEALSKQIGALRSYIEKDAVRAETNRRKPTQNSEPRTQNSVVAGGSSGR